MNWNPEFRVHDGNTGELRDAAFAPTFIAYNAETGLFVCRGIAEKARADVGHYVAKTTVPLDDLMPGQYIIEVTMPRQDDPSMQDVRIIRS